jgi:tetratricopeptide (TPR) repeat protein
VRHVERALCAAAAAAAAAAGCAYFNGMYYANRYARQATASEQAGRIGEARDRWQQAEIHADSVVAHHPKSRWAAEALLVRGRALVHLDQYADAAIALEEAARRSLTLRQHHEALGLLGRADLALGLLDLARAALDSAVESDRQEVRDEALLYRARVLVALSQPDRARADLARSRDPRAPYDLARLEVAGRDTAAAGALYDSLVTAKSIAEEAWRPALDSLASAGAVAHASQLVDQLVARPDLSTGTHARLMLDDADRRLGAADTIGATVELQGVVAVAPDSAAGQTAAVALCRLAIAGATTEAELAPQRERLAELLRAGGGAAREADLTLWLLGRIDSLAAAPRTPDAFWFQRAELLRDSLHAGRLATAAFAAMAGKFPESPWTPKALVAAIAGGDSAADSLRALLARRYGRSPYALAAGGATGGDSVYAVLEDSLQRLLAARPAPRGSAARGPRRPGQIDDVDDEVNVRRRPAGAPAPRAPARPQPAGPPRPEPPQ